MDYIKMFLNPDSPIFYTGYLPEIEVSPTKKDKEIYNYVKESIPRDEDRKYLLKLLEDSYVNNLRPEAHTIYYEPDGDYHKVAEKINNKLPIKDLSGLYSVQYTDTEELAENIRQLLRKNNIRAMVLHVSAGGYAVLPIDIERPHVDENISNNDVVKRLAEIHSISRNPKILKTPLVFCDIMNRLTKGRLYPNLGIAGGRAHMWYAADNPYIHKLYNINSFDKYMAEIAHSYGFSTFEDLGRYLIGISDQSVYEKPYSMEHTTHSYIEPLLTSYIHQGHMTLPEINTLVTNMVGKEKNEYKEQKGQDVILRLLEKIKSIIK